MLALKEKDLQTKLQSKAAEQDALKLRREEEQRKALALQQAEAEEKKRRSVA